MKSNRSIAIDGPAGAGKSTVAKRVAAKESLIYVDTGAMYRTMGLYFIRKGMDLNDEKAVSAVVHEPVIRPVCTDGEQKIFLGDEDVTQTIRQNEIGDAASLVSTYGAVRERLVELQQEIARTNDVVMDGRDIGTVVIPDAFLKIYLTAEARVRAERRVGELREKGIIRSVEEIEEEIRERDERDMNREISPLKQAEDAVLVDTTRMDIEEVTGFISAIYEGRINALNTADGEDR